jgi:hypothetical protein
LESLLVEVFLWREKLLYQELSKVSSHPVHGINWTVRRPLPWPDTSSRAGEGATGVSQMADELQHALAGGTQAPDDLVLYAGRA